MILTDFEMAILSMLNTISESIILLGGQSKRDRKIIDALQFRVIALEEKVREGEK